MVRADAQLLDRASREPGKAGALIDIDQIDRALLFLGIDTRLHPIMGWKLLLPVFAAAIFGGIGKPYGAIVGALIIGIAQEMSTLVISPAYKPAVAFGLMVLMLIWRPTGLFRGKVL